jgi:phenylacetate-coenzyme A ligase PaaK-like adenylate-forming protein
MAALVLTFWGPELPEEGGPVTASASFRELHKQLSSGRYVPHALPGPEDVARNRRELQAELAVETLEYARANVPYYERLLAELGVAPSSVRTIDDLRQFPILRKADVVVGQEAFLSRSAKIVSYHCTSGTSGRRLPFPVAEEELQAMAEFDALRAAGTGRAARRPFVLRVGLPSRRISGANHNGSAVVFGTVLNLDAADHRLPFDYVDHIMQWLLEPLPSQEGPRSVEVLWTTPPWLIRTITETLLARSVDLRATAVRSIVSSGGVVTNAMAEYVRDRWDAVLGATYSMTEIVGAHSRCLDSGWYHFDIFSVVEFVHPVTELPVAPGEEGVAVITSLYPFQQAQPMLRYWSGDVFTVREGECTCGFSGISGFFRGRLSECIDVSAVIPAGFGPAIIGPADVLEVLHLFPELPQFAKNPRFALSIDDDEHPARIALEVEVNPGQRCFEELASRIARELARRFSNTESGHLPMDRIVVRLIPKGDLSSHTGYYPDR